MSARWKVKLSKTHATIRLTHAQLEGVAYALQNTVDYPDAMEAIFDDGRKRRAAYNGAEVITRAWGASMRGESGEVL